MAIFINTPEFFVKGTTPANRSLATIIPELKIWNDFEMDDLQRDVSFVTLVIAVENHPKIGRVKVKLKKRPNKDKAFPGFSLHSKSLIWYNPETERLYIFKTKVTIMASHGGKPEAKEEIDSDLIAQYYRGDNGDEMKTYTDIH